MVNATDPKDGAAVVQQPLRVYGDDAYPAWHRRPLPLDAPRARFFGFKPETIVLKKGSIRREGALPLPCDILLERDVPVTLRDGVVIYTDVFRPVTDGSYPSIVSWSPYGKEIGSEQVEDLPGRSGVPMGAISELNKFEAVDPAFWVAQGYVVLNPDTRGAYKSGGNLVYWGRQLAEDGYDFIEWAAQQPWSSGKVGMAGNSFLAVSQWFIAAERPPHLAAIAPWEGLSDCLRHVFVRGGIPMLTFPELINQSLAGENLMEDPVRMAVEEQDDTLYWQDKVARVERIEVPAYIVASYDNMAHTQGTFDAYAKIGSPEKWLRIHNTMEWPDFYEPAHVQELLAFFDHYLKGQDNGWQETPRVRLAVIDPGGTDEVGRVVQTWPPAGYPHRKLYLTADGALSETPADAEGTARNATAGGPPAIFRMAVNHDAEIIGQLKLKLWVEAEGSDDIDLAVVVEKLDKDGKPTLHPLGTGEVKPLQAIGVQRASRRKVDPARSTEAQPVLLMKGEERLSPGEIVPLEISILPLGLRLRAGEILQVMIVPFAPMEMDLPLGSARISVPAEGYTYMPGESVEMQTLGGGAETSPPWAAEQKVPDDIRNAGTHILHMGGRYDSHLLVPMKMLLPLL